MRFRFPDPIELLIWVVALAICSYLVLWVVESWREALS